MSVKSSSADETFTLGKRLAPLFKKGSVAALKGPLGAGKTCLTKGIASGLGVTEALSSPTYTIVSEYEAVVRGEKITVYHIDAFRLKGDDDFSAIGGEEIIFGEGISIIEWSERISNFIPEGALKIDLDITGDNKRHIRVYKDESEYSGS